MKKALVIMGCVVMMSSFSQVKTQDIFDEWFSDLRAFEDRAAAKFKDIREQTSSAMKDLFTQAARDIIEEGDHYLIKVALAGFKKEEIKTEIRNNTIVVMAEKAKKAQSKDEKAVQYKEISESLKRVISLPSAVDETKAEASLNDGILTIKIPKKKEEKPASRSIPIK